MFETVSPHPELLAGEEKMLEFWSTCRAFEKLRAQLAGRPRWSFLDGPITANNPMGVHHAWGRTYKDAFQRYHAMTGHDQRFQNGFDCQGLWVEVEVERELGFTSKRDIEAYGLERFIETCKERVNKYAALITEQSTRLGMWMDWEHSYYTMSEENNYTIWAFLKKCHQRGFIYKGLDSMPWCPRCGTGISEQERKEGYRLIEDEAVYLKFPLRGRPGESLLVWTTTPWTLAANVAAAVHPDLHYAKVRQGDQIYYVAHHRLEGALGPESSREVLAEVRGEDMVGWSYDGPFDDLPSASRGVSEHRVIPWDEVSATEGTGIVHIAPGCGKEDFDLSKLHNLPVIAPIDEFGIYEEGFGPLTGKNASEVAHDIYQNLRAKDLFYRRETYRHDYPHCWRCDTALLFRAVNEWYIDMSWRDEIKTIVPKIRWIPDYGEAQELDWLNNMGDWMISKKRYWGLALPIWECASCGHFEVMGGIQELRDRAVEGWEQFEGHTPHRPWVDAVKIGCGNCGAKSSRIPDVGNPWLDAGIVPYSTVGYNTDREEWAKWIPADFVVESFPGQFRNWFYALLALSTMMGGIEPFRTLLGYASVRDEKGEEMHRSRGNAIYWDEAIVEVSADSLRWLFCRHTPTNNLHFGFNAPRQIERRVFGTLWNTYAFLANYARLDGFDPSATKVPANQRPEIDRWILSNLQDLVRGAREALDEYSIFPFLRQAEQFIHDLSNWYVRRNRRRFWRGRAEGEADPDKMAAYQTLHESLTTLLRLLAPVIPFLTERIWQNLRSDGDPESIHLCDYPDVDPSMIDEELSADMQVALEVVREAHALREQAHLRVRQPLGELRIETIDESKLRALRRTAAHLKDELNVKELQVTSSIDDITVPHAKPNFASLGPKFGGDAQRVGDAIRSAPADVVMRLRAGEQVFLAAAGGEVEVGSEDVRIKLETLQGWVIGEAAGMRLALDVRLTDQLQREGLARDLVRHIQQARRSAGLEISDRIRLHLGTSGKAEAAVRAHRDWIAGEVLAAEFSDAPVKDGFATTVELDGSRVAVSFRRI